MKVAVTRKNGGVWIMNLLVGNNPIDEIAKWPQEMQHEVVGVFTIDSNKIPSDRSFRDAWTFADDGRVKPDMVKAREIHRGRLRDLRTPKLEALDVEYLRAQEANDFAKLQIITQKKQELRDATKYPAIESADTPEKLKEAIPECLR